MSVGYDSGTYIPAFPLHEAAAGDVGTCEVDTFAWQVRGTPQASGANGRLLKFEGVSGVETLVPSSMTGAARAVSDAFHEGATVRVYRDWPGNISAWSSSNLDGYDDVVQMDGGADLTYEWAGEVMARHRFTIEGVAV